MRVCGEGRVRSPMLVPEFLRRIQETYLSSPGGQLLGSLCALVALAGVVVVVNRAGKPLKRRYSSRLTEALQAGVVAVWVILTVYWLTIVWRVVPALGLVFDATCPHPTTPIVHDVGGSTADAAWVNARHVAAVDWVAMHSWAAKLRPPPDPQQSTSAR